MKKCLIIMSSILAVIIVCILCFNTTNGIKTVKSENELKNLSGYNDYNYTKSSQLVDLFVSGPTTVFSPFMRGFGRAVTYDLAVNTAMVKSSAVFEEAVDAEVPMRVDGDYSKTNVQVENVDEADINKTDGKYIYSLSENKVIITDVRNPQEIKIASEIEKDQFYPVDLLLYKDKLVVIGEEISEYKQEYYWYRTSNYNTAVYVYDVSDHENPVEQKYFELYAKYYTSRAIDNNLYIISSSRSQSDDEGNIIHKYSENNNEKIIPLNDIHYIKDTDTKYQTVIASCDLDNLNEELNITDLLMNAENAYVSEKSIYLLDSGYYNRINSKSLKDIYGWKGIFGLIDNKDNDYYQTKIFKFDINGSEVKYSCDGELKGETINQYSLDERDGYLRIATNLGWNLGAKVVIYDNKLNKVGETDLIGKNESMYSSRFVGDKVYLVTYRNTDPLFVIDLSDVENPKVLGELKIPGYSTYLHPYDENHIIGIGMETKERTYKDSYGRVTSTYTEIIGMKMALFDVTDVSNPKQISQTVIGDASTTSAVLTNAKALLFSKEKELIAIPVNTYGNKFSIETYTDDNSSIISQYSNYGGDKVSEGYLVYNINLEEGFKLKGEIAHKIHKKDDDYYWWNYNSRLLRGLYINDNLFTISEDAIKVNRLSDLEKIDELKLIPEVFIEEMPIQWNEPATEEIKFID